MPQIRQLLRLLQQSTKLIRNIRQRINQLIERLPQSQQDTILVITLIAVLGFAGWIEYNGRTLTHSEIDIQPITLRSLPSLKERAEPVLHHNQSAVTYLAFSPDGKTLASGSQDGTIKLWNWQNETEESKDLQVEEPTKDKSKVLSAAFDGSILASVTERGDIKLWKVSENKATLLKMIPGKESVGLPVAFNQKGDILAGAMGDGTINLWKRNNESFSSITNLKPSDNIDNSVVALAFSSSNSREEQLLASSRLDGTINLWNIKNLGKPKILERHNKILSLAFSHNGQILASGSDDGTIKLWNPSNGRELRTLRSHPYPVNSLAFAPDDKALASGSDDETIKIWQAHPQILEGWRQPPLLRLW
jgi:WD40 repeat protein